MGGIEMAGKTYEVCPECQEKKADITYHTNPENFKSVNIMLGGGGPMGGGQYNASFRVCKTCHDKADGLVSKIKALVEPIKAEDEALSKLI